MIRDGLLWKNPIADSLLVLCPGASGTHRHKWPGYPATAAFFWMKGYHVYILETAGQDGHEGLFSPGRSINEAKHTVYSLLDLLNLDGGLYLLGSCAGGVLSICIAGEHQDIAKAVVCYETLPEYKEDEFTMLKKGMESSGMNATGVSQEEKLDMPFLADRVICPVAVFRGDKSRVYDKGKLQTLAALFCSAPVVKEEVLSDADHGVFKGENPHALQNAINAANDFFDIHKTQNLAQ